MIVSRNYFLFLIVSKEFSRSLATSRLPAVCRIPTCIAVSVRESVMITCHPFSHNRIQTLTSRVICVVVVAGTRRWGRATNIQQRMISDSNNRNIQLFFRTLLTDDPGSFLRFHADCRINICKQGSFFQMLVA